jgi:hypothetical protein
MAGLAWKRNADEILERRRRFFRREMLDSVLVALPVSIDVEDQWKAFESKWFQYEEGGTRPFPSNEEIYERVIIGQPERAVVEDDVLPVLYCVLDSGESMVGGMYGGDIRFVHRPRGAAFSHTPPVLTDYADIAKLPDPMAGPWAKRLEDLQEYCDERSGDNFAQHALITMDALNFVAEMRSATQAYLDIYEHPDEMRQLMEIAIDYNIRAQEAQMRFAPYQDGSFVMMGGWVPFPKAVLLSVDAYVICDVKSYVEYGFEYQARLLEHFGHGLIHFHCNRLDLAAEVAKLPGLSMFQFGGDTRDPIPEVEYVPQMRKVIGDIPIMVACKLNHFITHLRDRTLPPNVCYNLYGGPLSIDEANSLMDEVRAYRSG